MVTARGPVGRMDLSNTVETMEGLLDLDRLMLD
jgi:hypothetical protein